MKSIKLLCIFWVASIALPFTAYTQSSDQSDTGFINNYKRFRQLVDPLSSYSLYFVPDGASSKFMVNELASDMKASYHFLRKKMTVKQNADFQVAVLIDEFVKSPLYNELIGDQIVVGGTVRASKLVQPYFLTISIFVFANGKVVEFPLCVRKEFRKESKYGYVVPDVRVSEKIVTRVINGVTVTSTEPIARPPVQNTMDVYATALNKVKLTKNDLKEAFLQLLWSYRNYYVDRVD